MGCSDTGFYLRAAVCRNLFPNGILLPTTLTLTQSVRDVVSGVYSVGVPHRNRAVYQSTFFSIPIEEDGAITFTAPAVNPPPTPDSLSIRFRVNSVTNGSMVGGLNQLWMPAGEFVGNGELRIAGELRSMHRTAGISSESSRRD